MRGLIPPGLLVCHSCDNPPCCNPNHFFLGTALDNNGDAKRKGRTCSGLRNGKHTHPESIPRGDNHSRRKHPEWYVDWVSPSHLNPEIVQLENNGNAKLNIEKVHEIRTGYLFGADRFVLADMYGVTPNCISTVIRGEAWVS
jgi:hypothetical protein